MAMHRSDGGGSSSEYDPPFISFPHEPYPTSGDPTVGARITVLDDSGHNAFPGLALHDGDLVAIWRDATSHDVQTGASRGVLAASRSADLGRTWSTPATVVDEGSDDARDPTLTTLSDGRVALSYMVNDGTNATPKVRFSDDGGASFGTSVDASSGAVSDEGVSAPVVELDDGTLLIAVYGGGTARLLKSTDDGATFGSAVTIASSGGDWTEPYLLLLDDGTLLVALRENGARHIYMATSADNGATWSTPAAAFDGWGRPSLVQFSSGLVVCQYRIDTGSSSPSNGQYLVARSSRDSGASWDAQFTIDDNLRMAYAQPVEVSGGQAGLLYGLEDGGSGTATDANVHFRYLIDGDGITPVGDDTLTTGAEFTGLTDTPSSYAGQAGNAAVVNTAEDALEFAEVTTAMVVEAGHVDGAGTVLWRWGVDSLGRPYFDDTDGADTGDEAALIVDDGVFYAEEASL